MQHNLQTQELTLAEFAEDFAQALQQIDQTRAVHKNFQPGIGPFGEADAVRLALELLRQNHPQRYTKAQIKRKPDLLIPDQWQIECKIIRPFGDNGKEAENWSQNLLHPYPGNVSSISDCLKLISAECAERKAIVVFGYEHNPAVIPLEPCIRGFELLSYELQQIILSDRFHCSRAGLVHPVHQVLHVFAWEVLGTVGRKVLSESH